jgi:hypothetical protein
MSVEAKVTFEILASKGRLCGSSYKKEILKLSSGLPLTGLPDHAVSRIKPYLGEGWKFVVIDAPQAYALLKMQQSDCF